ncbi:UNVERIFIED_CONTAM: hypothetical protein FKN15_020319, partial [Acipenser sinensis]
SFKDEETVVLGAHNLKKEEKSQERLKIEKTFKYPEFDKHPKLNDLMLIKLKTKVKLNKKIKTLSLPKSGKDIKPDVKCKVCGWGNTVNNAHEGSDTLKEADVAVIDRKVCNKYYNGNPNITKDMLCAGDKKGKKDACTLDKAVKENKNVSFLPLPESGKHIQAGTNCHIAGWGLVRNGDVKGSDVLMEANVTVIDWRKCNSEEYYNLNPVITVDMLCAGSVDNKVRRDSCKGDSGGPLICNGEFRAVTSFGSKCGLLKKPGVYTLLSQKYIQWIKKVTRGDA